MSTAVDNNNSKLWCHTIYTCVYTLVAPDSGVLEMVVFLKVIIRDAFVSVGVLTAGCVSKMSNS